MLLALLLPYVVWLIFAYRYHFIDGVNLLMHEAGHVIFGFFGRTMHFLGGTLGQLFFPAAFVFYFWRRGQRFESYVVGLWLCESLMYTAEYMGDARAMRLPLVGGHIHDWNYLLAKWGLLTHAEDLGQTLHILASIGAIICLGGAVQVLRDAGRRAEHPPTASLP